MQNIFAFMILLLVLLPVIGGCLLCRRGIKAIEIFIALLVFAGQLGIVITLEYFLLSAASSASVLDWTLQCPFSFLEEGLFDQLSWRFDVESGFLLFLLPILFLTSFFLKSSSSSDSSAELFFLLAGANLVVVANDVASLMGGAMLSSLTLIATRSPRFKSRIAATSSDVSMTIIGWASIFAGIAWLAACAALVRAAPHGLPGMTTTNLNDLAALLLNAAKQHPAAQFTWQQYRMLPSAAILLGVSLLGGLIPVHGLFSRTIEHGSLKVRLWSIALAKIALILLYRLLIEPDSASWSATSKLLSLPVLGAFVYGSYLMAASTTTSMQFSRLIVWGQQLTLLGWLFIPNSGVEILWLSHCVQLPGCVLLALLMEFSTDGSKEELFIPKLIGIMSVGATSSLAGLLLVWDTSLQLSTSTMFGAAGFVLFAIAVLISTSGLANFMEGPLSESQREPSGLILRQKSVLFCWSCLAILGSLLAPFVLGLAST